MKNILRHRNRETSNTFFLMYENVGHVPSSVLQLLLALPQLLARDTPGNE